MKPSLFVPTDLLRDNAIRFKMATMFLRRLLVSVRSHETVQGSYNFSPISLKIGAVNVG